MAGRQRQNSIIRGYDNATNKGIDIGGTRTKRQIRSSRNRPLRRRRSRGYGKLILISHSDFSITAYAHNDTILVQKTKKSQQASRLPPWAIATQTASNCISKSA